MKIRSGGNPDISLARLIKLLALPTGIFTLWASDSDRFHAQGSIGLLKS